MLNFYVAKYTTKRDNGWEISDVGGRILVDERDKPADEVITITWDNLHDFYYEHGYAVGWNIWNFKKGKLISFYDMELFNRKTWDIAEWKTPNPGLTVSITYIKIEPTLKEILGWSQCEKAMQYLKEHGL